MPVVIPPGTALAGIKVEDEVTYNIGGVVYAGKIRAIVPDDLRPYGIGLEVDCQDFTSLLNDDICAYTNAYANPVRTTGESDMQRISWLLQSWGRDGISAYNVQMLYASMPPQDFTGMTLTDAIKAVLAYSGGSFYVDFGKDLHTFIAEAVIAPFALSDSPDGVSSFAYADFQYPWDSVDLRNAVFVVPGPSVPSAADSVTVTITTAGGPIIGASLSLASLKPRGRAPIKQVGFLGAFTESNSSSITPAFAQDTIAGNTLVAWLGIGSVAEATTSALGWERLEGTAAIGPTRSSIWIRRNCQARESPPTFNLATPLSPSWAQLAEFSGVLDPSPLDGSGVLVVGSGGASPLSSTITTPQLDQVLGNLLLAAGRWEMTGVANATFSEIFNNGAVAVHAGDSGSTSPARHASFSYAITQPGAIPTWYTDEASIASYKRREAFLEDSSITTQAALDARGAAELAANANPRRECSLMCDQVGLAAGQIVSVTNALHGLSAQPFRIQKVETSYSENVPRFAVEFVDPAVTLAGQLRKIQGQAAEDTAAASTTATVTLESLAAIVSADPRGLLPEGYAEVVAIQGTFTALTDITGLARTITVAAGRRIRISCQIGGSSSIAGDLIGAYIQEGAATLQQDQFAATLALTAYMTNFDVVLQPSAGSHTYKISMARVSGTGNITMQAGPTFPASITVEDLGT